MKPNTSDNSVIASADEALIEAFIDACWLERGLSKNTLLAYRSDLQQFCQTLKHQRPVLNAMQEDIQHFLGLRLKAKQTAHSICRQLSSLRRFFQYLHRENHRSDDPTQMVDRPKLGRPLPHSLSEHDVENLLQAPNTDTALGLRDKAMLELLYASGLRVSELIGLKHYQLDLQQGFVRITGKGNKERLVPIGEEASLWLEKYLMPIGRPQLTNQSTSEYFFITRSGTNMTRQTFWYLIKKYALKAGIQQPISPHTLRHAFATHLLNHGADLRVLQMLLGHSNVSTTQIYTHIATQEIQSIHAQHHPRG